MEPIGSCRSVPAMSDVNSNFGAHASLRRRRRLGTFSAITQLRPHCRLCTLHLSHRVLVATLGKPCRAIDLQTWGVGAKNCGGRTVFVLQRSLV